MSGDDGSAVYGALEDLLGLSEGEISRKGSTFIFPCDGRFIELALRNSGRKMAGSIYSCDDGRSLGFEYYHGDGRNIRIALLNIIFLARMPHDEARMITLPDGKVYGHHLARYAEKSRRNSAL